MKVEIEGYTKTEQDDGTIVFKPIETKLKFTCHDFGFAVLGTGAVCYSDATHYNVHHSLFRTEADAQDVARYQRVLNAVCRAVKQIDPDFVPDWDDANQDKYTVFWSGSRWENEVNWYQQKLTPPVSTRGKAYQVIELLEAEGIVPVGGEK